MQRVDYTSGLSEENGYKHEFVRLVAISDDNIAITLFEGKRILNSIANGAMALPTQADAEHIAAKFNCPIEIQVYIPIFN